MDFKVYICPVCREQVERDDDYDYMHHHDGDYIDALELTVPTEVTGPDWQEALDRRAREWREARDAAKEKARRDRHELAEMERAWATTAPPGQLAALEQQRRNEKGGLTGMMKALQSVYNDSIRLQLNQRGLLFGPPDDRPEWMQEADGAVRRNEERERLRETLRRFDAEGPAVVGFWKLRDTQHRLRALGATEERIPAGYRPRPTQMVHCD